MTLIDQLRSSRRPVGWTDFGYLRNPFPPRGQVLAQVYVPRPELRGVVDSLATFLKGDGQGRTWAIAGDAGVGKSNFLQHVSDQLVEASEAQLVDGLAFAYLTSQQMNPRALTDSIARSFGEDRVAKLYDGIRNKSVPVSETLTGTPFGALLQTIREDSSRAIDLQVAAAFSIRWLGGQQTYAAERAPLGINTRERLPPALALPWLRYLLDLMVEANVVSKVVLLLDEFEDVQALTSAAQNDYLMTLKGLVNAFNLERLFLVIAGQPTAFARMGERFPSLKERWQVVSLEPLRRPDEAVVLARACMEYGRKLWTAENPTSKKKFTERPSELEVKAAFGEVLARSLSKSVTQREFLAALHEIGEKLVSEGPSS